MQGIDPQGAGLEQRWTKQSHTDECSCVCTVMRGVAAPGAPLQTSHQQGCRQPGEDFLLSHVLFRPANPANSTAAAATIMAAMAPSISPLPKLPRPVALKTGGGSGRTLPPIQIVAFEAACADGSLRWTTAPREGQQPRATGSSPLFKSSGRTRLVLWTWC